MVIYVQFNLWLTGILHVDMVLKEILPKQTFISLSQNAVLELVIIYLERPFCLEHSIFFQSPFPIAVRAILKTPQHNLQTGCTIYVIDKYLLVCVAFPCFLAILKHTHSPLPPPSHLLYPCSHYRRYDIRCLNRRRQLPLQHQQTWPTGNYEEPQGGFMAALFASLTSVPSKQQKQLFASPGRIKKEMASARRLPLCLIP